MTDAPELKPCPFCGGVHLGLYKEHHDSYVECHGCGAYGPDMPKGEWNTRADLPATDAQAMQNEKVKALVDALHEARRMLLHYGTRDTGGMSKIDAALAEMTHESE